MGGFACCLPQQAAGVVRRGSGDALGPDGALLLPVPCCSGLPPLAAVPPVNALKPPFSCEQRAPCSRSGQLAAGDCDWLPPSACHVGNGWLSGMLLLLLLLLPLMPTICC
jgi:hypothetical protein